MNKAAQAYFQTNVSTADQGRLLIMLYDGALKFLQQAREKMLVKDYAAKGILISKVIDIINELAGSLNMEKGGSLATNLNNLYLLCSARLLQANLKLDVKALDSVVKILEGLRSAYAEILNKPEVKKAVAQIQSRMQPLGSMTKKAQPLMQGSNASPISGLAARAAYGRMQNFQTMQAQAMPKEALTSEQPQAVSRPAPASPPLGPTVFGPVMREAAPLSSQLPNPEVAKPEPKAAPQGFATNPRRQAFFQAMQKAASEDQGSPSEQAGNEQISSQNFVQRSVNLNRLRSYN